MRKFKVLSVILAIVLVFASCAVKKANSQSVVGQVLSLENDVFSTKYGNLYTTLKVNDFLNSGFEYGDIVNVDFAGCHIEAPVVDDYAALESGALGVVVKPKRTVMLCLNMANFAETYGIGVKKTNPDNSWYWVASDTVTFPIDFVFSMKEKGGYLSQYLLTKLERTNDRKDYKELSDADFANFRKVETTGMRNLYRTSNPVNSELNRNTYADKCLAEAQVKTIMNLADTEEATVSKSEYKNSYYSTCDVVYLSLGLDFAADSTKQVLAEGFRYFINHKGPYAVHCTEGKDRAGVVCAVLECLMGASANEVGQDYMKTFENYYHVEKNSEQYNAILSQNIEKTLQTVFQVSDLTKANLQECAEKYIMSCGLTKTEVEQLKANL